MYDVLWCTIEIHYTLQGITQIYFKSKLCLLVLSNTTDEDPGISGCQKIGKNMGNQKTYIARSTIHPNLSKIKNHY